jgi:hypothetical protein
MPGLDTDVIVHKLPWREDCPLEKQNAGATYQRAMVTLFHDMIHYEIECYVDDMIAKSQTEVGHSVDLVKLLDQLRQFRLRLNSNKCTFRVRSGKMFRFILREESRLILLKKKKKKKRKKEKNA